MDDSYQPLSRPETCEYYMIHQQTSPPTSISTASSPMITAMQSNTSGPNWATHNFPFDPTVNQYEYENTQRNMNPVWSLPYPQQHNIVAQPNYQQQLHNQLHYQQQHVLFRSHPDMQQPSIYQNYEHINGEIFQVPTLPADIYYAPQQQHNVLHDVETQLNANIPIHTEADRDKISPSTSFIMPSITETNIQESRLSPLPNNVNQYNYESVSPNTTPLSSPVLSSTTRKRKRTGKATATCSNQSSLSQLGNSSISLEEVDERGKKRTKQQEEGVDGNQGGVELRGNRKAVDQLLKELHFLGDECATILMMLDSLRNAFLADIPASKLKPNSKNVPLTSTFDSKEETHIDQTAYAKNLTNQVPVIINTRRRSKIIAQNPEMEREIRIAYDDLMIQVRQLEKKLDALEGKRKKACHVEKGEKKGSVIVQPPPPSDNEDDEDTNSQSSGALSSMVNSEEEEEEDYLLDSNKKGEIISRKG